MKNKNKGFTLIELLIVISIMGVIGTIITISFNYTLKETNQKKCDDFVSEIEDGACVYSGLANKEIKCERPGCELTLDILVKEGIVTSEKDVCTGNEINLNETVSVSWNEDNEKICEYNGVKTYER